MERFEDLMGITHDTGDAFLDKKLNQNTAYILGKIATGVIGAGILGKKAKVKTYGGDFAKAIRPYATQGLKDLQDIYEEGPRVFEGERVAGFTDPQLAAQTSLLALSTAQPDYYQTALGGLEEAIGMQRQAATGITAEDIARQREILEPTAEAQRMAQEQAFRRAIRDIGVGAGGAGVGALEGARADILRSGAAGELAIGMADIEGQLQRQALQQAEADRARQAAGATSLAQLSGQQLGVSQAGFGEQVERIGLGAGVGQEQRELEQQLIGAEMAKFAEEDPMAFAERYLQTIYAAPTTGVQRVQKPSGLQQALGVVTALSGAAKAGAPIPGFSKHGGGIAALAMGSNVKTAAKKYKLATEGKLDETMTVEDLAKALESDKVKKEVQEKFKKDLATVAPASDNSAMQGGDQTPTEFGQGQIDPKPLAPADNSRMFSNQALARQLMMQRLGGYGMRNMGGGIAQLQEGGQAEKQEGAFSRIMSSVGSGLRSVASDFMSPVKYYSENLDPFRGYDGYDRMRIGLSILATQPELGESSLGTISRGALAGVQAASEDRLEREDTGTKSVGTFSDSEFMNIAERFFKQQNISSKRYADKLDELIRQSKLEALTLAQQGLLSGSGSAFLRQAGEDIFRDKLKGLINIPDNKDKKPVDNSKTKRTGMNRAARGTPAARKNLEDF